MVQVVAGHGFEIDLKSHGAALGVGHLAEEVGLAAATDEFEVPLAGGAEELERGGQAVDGIACSPGVLVEGLDNGIDLGEGQAEAEAVDEFAVGEVGDDLAGAPLTGGDGRGDLLRGELAYGLVDEAGRGGEDGAGVLIGEEAGIGIEGHDDDGSMSFGLPTRRSTDERIEEGRGKASYGRAAQRCCRD